MIPIAVVYYWQGKSAGITETIYLIHCIDPEFISKMSPKLKEILDANARTN